MGNKVEISGNVAEIIYSNTENGYTVCEIDSIKEGMLTATGYLPYISEGDNLCMVGEWVVHPDYGEQFKVNSFEKVMPADEESIYRYLASGVVKGVREVTAKKLVDKFGAKTLEIMLNEPAKLAEISGISKKKALEIGESFLKLQSVQNIIMFLQKFGVSANFAMKVHKVLGINAVEMIKNNPYILADKIDGISFKTSDNIAFVTGIAKNSIERIRAGIKYILSAAAYNSGHTFLPKTLLVEDAAYHLQITEEEAESGIASLMTDHSLYTEEIEKIQACYLSGFLSAENYIAKRLVSLSLAEQKFGMTDSQSEECIDEIEKNEGVELAYEQRNAVITALKCGCCVITGGPGTGKTTTINTIIKLMEKLRLSIALAAPTGRAAKRMSEVTGHEAKTIHRLLGVIADNENAFTHDETNPLTADVIILDEVSMVDVPLMNAFLRAVKNGARVIFSGDSDQLPSVGPGNVLGDIISSGIIPVIRLERIFRQAEESLIVVNAHRINRGEMPELSAKNKDFFFLRRKDAEQTAKTITDLYKNRLPSSYHINPIASIQVLSPSKKGAAGTVMLNKAIQQAVNPPDILKVQYQYGQTVFRAGDKVMQIKNNYDIPWMRGNGEHGTGIFNGDMGIISDISTKDKMMTIIFDEDKEVEYQFSFLDELDLAYAVTVHKSQGSEFPIIVMPVCTFAPALMCKNLFYTAVTRAKTMVVLVGGEAAVERMVKETNMRHRYTGLAYKLKCAENVTIAQN